MTIEQYVIAALLPMAAYGGVKVVAKVDKRIERIRKTCFELATVCSKAGLEILDAFFVSIAVGDKSGAIRAAKQIIQQLAPDKIWEALDSMFFKQLVHRLANRPEDEMKIVRLVDANRVAKDALLANQARINADNAKRRDEEIVPSVMK